MAIVGVKGGNVGREQGRDGLFYILHCLDRFDGRLNGFRSSWFICDQP